MLKSVIATIFALLAATFGLHHGAVATAPTSVARSAHPSSAQLAASAAAISQTATSTTPHFQDLSSQPHPASQRTPAPTSISATADNADSTISPASSARTISAALDAQPADPLVAYATKGDLASTAAALQSEIAALASAPWPTSGPSAPITVAAFAPSQRINQLSNITVSGVSGLTPADIPSLAYLPSAGGIVSGLSTFSNASTSLLSVSGPAYFGTTATSTFGSDGSLTLASALGVPSGGTGWANINAGSILFGNGASALATSSNLFWDNATSRLGIGTTTPGSTFSIQGIANWTTATSTFYSSGGINLTSGCFALNGTCVTGGGGGSGTVGSGTQGQFTFYNAAGTTLTATSSIFIAQSGSIGIGTTTPSGKLNIANGNLVLDRTSTIVQTPGAVGSGNESQTLFKMNTPAGNSTTTAPYVLLLGGSSFTDGATVWDPALYYGYNADRALSTQPTMRYVIEGDYVHSSRDDFETYWEYISSTGATAQRPIFFFHQKDGPVEGLQFNTNNLNWAPEVPNTSMYFYTNSGNNNSSNSTTWQDGSGILLIASNNPNNGAVLRLANTGAGGPYAMNGGVELQAFQSATGNGQTHANSIAFMTGASSADRMVLDPAGNIYMYTSNDRTGSNYEGVKWSFATGTIP